MNVLCQKIAVEQDQNTFTRLIQQLNELLSRKNRRLEEREADDLRRACRGRVMLAGVAMAFMLTIPVFNLVAPIAATAFAVHLFEAMRGSSKRGDRPIGSEEPAGLSRGFAPRRLSSGLVRAHRLTATD